MSFELLEVGLLGGAIGFVCHLVDRFTSRKTKVPNTDEKRCSGYQFGRGVVGKMRDDCTALRSTDCKDGRCSYHCEQMCKCITALGLR